MRKHLIHLSSVMYSYVQTQLCGRVGWGGRVGCMGLQFDGVVIRPIYRKNVSTATAVYHPLYCLQCRTNKEDYGTCYLLTYSMEQSPS